MLGAGGMGEVCRARDPRIERAEEMKRAQAESIRDFMEIRHSEETWEKLKTIEIR